jgi:dihydrofolate synthase / folylpolyglutamate synthase
VRTLAEWLRLQESVHPKSIDLGLARVGEVAARLGLTAPAFAVITVGGTNGKGSVAAHLEALALAQGQRTGLFTSPHFLRYHERIRVQGEEVSDPQLIDAFERIEAARAAVTLTFFEYNTLAALLIFHAQQVELAVLEVGLGGRLDATNLLPADVAVLASVGFDHRDYLGETLEAIGAEKAGIFRAGRPVVLGSPDMPASVYARMSELGAPARIAGRDFRWQVHGANWDYHGPGLELTDLPPSALAGSIQYRNAATALAAFTALPPRAAGGALQAPAVAAALRRVRLAGRFQVVAGAVEWILDIAHNEPAAQTLAQLLAERALPRTAGTRRGRTLAVIGVLADKDAPAIARALAPRIDRWIVCTLPGERGSEAAALAARMALPAGSFALAPSVEAACEQAQAEAQPGDRVVVCGSVYTVGPALAWLRIY